MLDRCDNHYTTKTPVIQNLRITMEIHALGSGPTTLGIEHLVSVSCASRDRIVVSTLRCGRSNPGSNPGHGSQELFKLLNSSVPAVVGNGRHR